MKEKAKVIFSALEVNELTETTNVYRTASYPLFASATVQAANNQGFDKRIKSHSLVVSRGKMTTCFAKQNLRVKPRLMT